MVINLINELVITSDTTIDGRGVKVEICGGTGGLSVTKAKNVIIHGLFIHEIKPTQGGTVAIGEGKPLPRSHADGDGVRVCGSTQVWIDHCSFSGGHDGLVDVTGGSTLVTVSNCKFNDHDKVMLLGAADGHVDDKAMQVTVAYNKFSTGCVQRMPRCRHGFFQVVNNDYDKWAMYAIGGTSNPTILCQGNRFVAPDDKHKLVTQRQGGVPEEEWQKWNWRNQDNILLNGAVFTESGIDPPMTPELQAAMIPPEPATAVEQITKDAGFLICAPGTPC